MAGDRLRANTDSVRSASGRKLRAVNSKVLVRLDSSGNARLTLNRPQAHNAFDPEMVRELTRCLRELQADASVRALVIGGAGRSFCAGADIEHMQLSAGYSRSRNFRDAQAAARMFHALKRLTKPTIACVHGAVRGGGIGLVAACDIAIAARNATFRLSEVKLGIIPAMISPYVIAAMGERAARRYMLTGEAFSATEALRIGLVHEVVEDSELDASVGRILAELASSGPRAVAAVKDLIPLAARTPLGATLVEETARRIAAIRATPEAQEGLSAFLEKRPAAWIAPSPRLTPHRTGERGKRRGSGAP